MRLRLLPTLSLFLAGSLLLSCDKDEDVVTPTTSSSALTRTFSFTNPVSEETIRYTGDSLTTTAVLDEEELFIRVDTQGSTKRDDLSLTLDRDLFNSGTLQDYYTVESLPNEGNGDVQVIYTYDSPNNSGSLYMSPFDNMSGRLVITELDTENKLISGNYEITIPDTFDPDAATPTSNRRATITLRGEFSDIKIVE